MNPFAYLFERFPSRVQTFCYREAAEMARQVSTGPGASGPIDIYAIRNPNENLTDLPQILRNAVVHIPDNETLRTPIRLAREKGMLPPDQDAALREMKACRDQRRVEEAIWLGPILQRRGIVHVHTHFAGMAGRTAYWLKKLFGVTYSFTAHADDIFCETEFPVSLRKIIDEALTVVTVADYSLYQLKRDYPEHSDKFFRVYNGIDLADFPEAQPPEQEGIHIVSVGRCVEKKGFPDFIEACRLIRAQGMEFTATIVGGGILEESLRKQIAESGLGDVMKVTGEASQELVREELHRASLFVLACCEEADGGMDNLPTVITEAMAGFLPVVSTKIAGVPEQVVDGVTGLLTDPREPGQLADAMMKVLKGNPREMGRLGRQRVEEILQLSHTTRQLREIITAGLSLRNQPRDGDRR